MGQIEDCFVLTTINSHMVALIDVAKGYNHFECEFDKEAVVQFLYDNKITYGIDGYAIETLISAKDTAIFPLKIAEGLPARNGADGELHHKVSFDNNTIREKDEWNFRDVMRIPSVTKGQLLATLKPPTEGENGMNVYGTTVHARLGKPHPVKAGKNVVFQEEELSFYAETEGQFSATDRLIQIFDVFEVNEDLTMKNGNLNFVGSITIKGDVPSGYSVKAKGDIRIFGMVEAATIEAEGSVYVSEGISGLQKGRIIAGENLHIGYINQGKVYADTINVENSILHSEITARHQVFCQRGNIIGGSISAGNLIEAKDIGNRLHTKTEIILGLNKATDEKEKNLRAKKEELLNTLTKLKIIGDKLNEGEQNQDDLKGRVTRLRIKNSVNKTTNQLQEIEETLQQLNPYLGSEWNAELQVKGHLFPSVLIAFGKYKRKIETNHQFVTVKLDNNEVTVRNIK